MLHLTDSNHLGFIGLSLIRTPKTSTCVMDSTKICELDLLFPSQLISICLVSSVKVQSLKLEVFSNQFGLMGLQFF